jgi:hypothetical protein
VAVLLRGMEPNAEVWLNPPAALQLRQPPIPPFPLKGWLAPKHRTLAQRPGGCAVLFRPIGPILIDGSSMHRIVAAYAWG